MNLQRCTALIALLVASSPPALAAQASPPDSPRAGSAVQTGQGVYTTTGNEGSARGDRKGSYKSLSTHGGSEGADSDAGGTVLRTPPARHHDARRDSGRAGYENYSLGGFISIERGGPQPEGNSRNGNNR